MLQSTIHFVYVSFMVAFCGQDPPPLPHFPTTHSRKDGETDREVFDLAAPSQCTTLSEIQTAG